MFPGPGLQYRFSNSQSQVVDTVRRPRTSTQTYAESNVLTVMNFFFSRIFPFIFVVVGAIAALFGIHGIIKAKASVDWPSSPGRIVSSTVESHRSTGDSGPRSTTYHAEISYEFSIEGTTFNGNRVAYGDYGSNYPSHARRIANRYPKGKSVTVYYMPENPKECLLEPGLKAQAWILPGLGLIFFAAGSLMVYFCRRRTTSSNQDILSQQTSGDGSSFEPMESGDPIAMETQWTPNKSGGASFRTHKIVRGFGTRLTFRLSLGAKLFFCLIFLIGIGVLVGGVVVAVNGIANVLTPILMCISGSVFVVASGSTFYVINRPIVFDKDTGCFWKGRRSPRLHLMGKASEGFVRLHDIHAIQLVSEVCTSESDKNPSSYYSYEINIVLKDASRVNIIDHGNLNRIREDAQALSTFLDVPMWDTTYRDC